MNPIQRNQSPSDRIREALKNVNEPTSCPDCGSIFFIEVKASMYTGGSYGLRNISTAPKTAYYCLCGTLVVPSNAHTGNTPGSEGDLFSKSLMAAQDALKRRLNINKITESVVGVKEFEELQQQVHSIELLLEGEEVGGPENATASDELEDSEERAIAELERNKTTADPAVIEAVAKQAETPEPPTMTPPALRTGRQSADVAPGVVIRPRPEKRADYGRGGAKSRLARQGNPTPTEPVNA